jgi:hypothetical protein
MRDSRAEASAHVCERQKETDARRAPVSAAMVRRSAVLGAARSGAASAANVVGALVAGGEILFIARARGGIPGASSASAPTSRAAPAGAAGAARSTGSARATRAAGAAGAAGASSSAAAAATGTTSAAAASPAGAPPARATCIHLVSITVADVGPSCAASRATAAAHRFLVRRIRLEASVASVLLVGALISILICHVTILLA